MSQINEINGFIYITAEGLYVKVCERLTHIGTVGDIEYVRDINEATVFSNYVEQKLLSKAQFAAKLRATCVVNRTVTISCSQDD